jgi:hypothetical protein
LPSDDDHLEVKKNNRKIPSKKLDVDTSEVTDSDDESFAASQNDDHDEDSEDEDLYLTDETD